MSTKPADPTPAEVYIALGTNIGDRQANLHRAIKEVDALRQTTVEATSAFYETKARFVEDQPDFLNACARLQTSLSPRSLLDHLLSIEEKMGRVRNIPKGPRIIDLDILFYDDRIIDEEGLTIPHPDLHNRDFVLKPLVEIAADLMHPLLHKTITELSTF